MDEAQYNKLIALVTKMENHLGHIANIVILLFIAGILLGGCSVLLMVAH